MLKNVKASVISSVTCILFPWEWSVEDRNVFEIMVYTINGGSVYPPVCWNDVQLIMALSLHMVNKE